SRTRQDRRRGARAVLWWGGQTDPPPGGVPVLDVGYTALTLVLAVAACLLVRSLERR
ncbi:hypothetical protein GTQ99_06995, partial [Kineococcus sp. T13]|nr:hypothetical protein [Kineococcus vitellinus]